MRRALVILLLISSGSGAAPTLEPVRQVAAPGNLETLAVGGVLASAAHLLDAEVDGMWPAEMTAGLTNLYGSSAHNLPASLALWTAGRLTGRPAARAAGRDLVRCLLTTQALVGPAKWLSGRERPDGSNHRSFPSGHTANAFAVARLTHLRHGAGASLPLYAVGALTAMGRIEHQRHYLSDVVMGAAVGIVAANCVTQPSRTVSGDETGPLVSILAGATGLSVRWSF